ncbi:probable WRKY transcription factor protein 1 isoform X2 [Microplitis mediator]|nr:probable WRKY transcription factor protein 1 isoform X2 [Microplitis mediator]
MRTDCDEAAEKSDDNLGDESEFDLRQSDSDADEVDEEEQEGDDEEDDEEDEDGDEAEGYFEKNRAPLRKSPSLIQYWIDTGRPPILMSEDLDESNILNEDVKANKLIHSMEVEPKRRSNSLLSSVDTAAYILSNTNVTAKAEAIAIVEGAKSLDLNDTNVNATVPSCLDNEIINCDIRNKSPVKNNQGANKINLSPIIENINLDKINPSSIEGNNLNVTDNNKTLITKSQLISKSDESENKITNDGNVDKSEIEATAQCSPKIADVLPIHDDPTKAKVIESSNISKEHDDLNSLKSLKLTWNNTTDTKTVNNRKSLRKKLYTQRSSPVNFVLSTTPISVKNGNDSDLNVRNNNNCDSNYRAEKKILKKLHPAFATPLTDNTKKCKRIKRASWARRMNRYSKMKTEKSSDDEAESNSDLKSESMNSIDNKDSVDKIKRKSKKLSRHSVRQSLRSKVSIDYNEILSNSSGEEEKLMDTKKAGEKLMNTNKTEDKLMDTNKAEEKLMDTNKAGKKLQEKVLEKNKIKEVISSENKVVNNKNNIQVYNPLIVCKRLTINLEQLPVNYTNKLRNKQISEIQNIDDSQESDGSTILMYECVRDNKDNTDIETVTEVSHHESEDDKSRGSVSNPEKLNKPFIQRCLGSLSDKNFNVRLNITKLDDKFINRKFNDTDDDSSDVKDKNLKNCTIRSSDKSSEKTKRPTKTRVITFSSDEEDFVKVANKNAEEEKKLMVNSADSAESDAAKNCDRLIDDLTSEPTVSVSSLLCIPTETLKIISNSGSENSICPDGLTFDKKGTRQSINTKRKESNVKSTEIYFDRESENSVNLSDKISKSNFEKSSLKFSSGESVFSEEIPKGTPKKFEMSNGNIEETIFNNDNNNYESSTSIGNKSELNRNLNLSQNKVQKFQNLIDKGNNINDNNNKLISDDRNKKSTKRFNHLNESDSSNEFMVSPPKKIKISDDKNSKNTQVHFKNISKNESNEKSKKLNNKIKKSGLSSALRKQKLSGDRNDNLIENNEYRLELQTPVNKIFSNRSSVKKHVSFATKNFEKIFVTDESSNESLFNSTRPGNTSLSTSPSSISNCNDKKINLIINSSTVNAFEESGLNRNNLIFTGGINSDSQSKVTKKIFTTRFYSDSEDSND